MVAVTCVVYDLFVVVVIVVVVFFFNDTATTEIYTLSLHDALPIWVTIQNCSGRRDLAAINKPVT